MLAYAPLIPYISGMSSTARVPVCVTLPPELIERADRIADQDDRSRSYVVAQALRTFCEAAETPVRGAGLCPGVADTAGLAAPPSAPAGGPSYPARLHQAHARRQLAAHRAADAALAEAQERALAETAAALRQLTGDAIAGSRAIADIARKDTAR
jgi:predicted transcriptional regulator